MLLQSTYIEVSNRSNAVLKWLLVSITIAAVRVFVDLL
jgi:hypothetical protein